MYCFICYLLFFYYFLNKFVIFAGAQFFHYLVEFRLQEKYWYLFLGVTPFFATPLLYSVQLCNDRAAIFAKAYTVVRLYFTQLQTRFLLKLRKNDYL